MNRMITRALIVSLAAAIPASGANIVPIDGTAPDGRTYGQLADAWWQWAVSIPAATNPITDTTGEHAALGQSGDVYFLAGTFGDGLIEREINEGGEFDGKYLFFPVINWFEANDPGDTRTEEQLRQLAADGLGPVSTLFAAVDGQQVPDLWTFRADSPPGGFDMILPDDNVFGAPSGTYTPTITDGWWLLVEPLDPNSTHTVRFDGRVGDPEAPDFHVAVDYFIVPEPVTASMLLFGGLGLLRLRRRR